MTAPKIVLPYINIPTRSVFYGRCLCSASLRSKDSERWSRPIDIARTLREAQQPRRPIPAEVHSLRAHHVTQRHATSHQAGRRHACCGRAHESLRQSLRGNLSARLPQPLANRSDTVEGVGLGVAWRYAVFRTTDPKRHSSSCPLGRPEDAAGDSAGTCARRVPVARQGHAGRLLGACKGLLRPCSSNAPQVGQELSHTLGALCALSLARRSASTLLAAVRPACDGGQAEIAGVPLTTRHDSGDKDSLCPAVFGVYRAQQQVPGFRSVVRSGGLRHLRPLAAPSKDEEGNP